MEKLKSIGTIYSLVGLPQAEATQYSLNPNLLPLFMFSHLFDIWGKGEIIRDKKQPFKHAIAAEIELKNKLNQSLKQWIYCLVDENYKKAELFYLIIPRGDFPFRDQDKSVYSKNIVLTSENDNHVLSDEGEKTNLHNASDRFYFENHFR